MKQLTPAYLLRSVLVAVMITVVVHFLADYFGWHLFTEAGGYVARAG